MATKRKRESDAMEFGDDVFVADEDDATKSDANVPIPQARWRAIGSNSDPHFGRDVAMKAVFSPTSRSSVDHLLKCLTMLGQFNDVVCLEFARAIDPEEQSRGESLPSDGAMRVLSDRDSSRSLLFMVNLRVEIPVLSEDRTQRCLTVHTASVLKFLKAIDTASRLELVKYRNQEELHMTWVSDKPGFQDNATVRQVQSLSHLEDDVGNPTAEELYEKLSQPAPSIVVVFSSKELIRILQTVQPNKDADGKKDNGFAKGGGGGATSALEVEFLVPEKLVGSQLRQVEFHVGGIFSGESSFDFFRRCLAVESPKTDRQLEDPWQRHYLTLDMTLTEHHLEASDRPKDRHDILARMRLSSTQTLALVKALDNLQPAHDKINLFFPLPSGFDWDTDFSRASHPRSRRIDRPLGVEVQNEYVVAYVFVAGQIVDDDE